ncbi:hypothetical protein [Methylobacterium sp. E-046]|uniref:hypothetical protein n=1 Tax=Methylobacterium sp. E-046 TaxID=2836576 RepID=UPI001FB95542|nr:hypothetical protein [Methylobacterium sp. E-046]
MAAAIPAGADDRELSRQRDKGCGAATSEFSRRREKATGAGWIRPFDTYSWRRAFTPQQESENRSRVRFCQDRAWRLTEWERGFLNNVARLRGNLSIRQADRLAEMTDRLDMEVRRAC